MTPTITRVLVPTDFSETSDAALDFARVIAETFGASLHLVHVFEDPFVAGAFAESYAALPPDMRTALIEDATTRLHQRLPECDRNRFHATTEVVSGISASAIVEYARNHKIDLIVMGTHGRTGVAHVLMGSVAERVVRTATCPVLTVHAEQPVAVRVRRPYLPEMPTQIAS
ncbi:MAG TPA: universal stress protein [Vicinamibacterales bacterium]|nr:universal stress protein [Vicinamibacterales bacterium]